MISSLSTPPGNQRGFSRKKTLIAVVAVTLAALVAAGGAYHFMRDTEAATASVPAPAPAPVFVEVAPITVNLADRMAVLYVSLSLAVSDDAAASQLRQYMPTVRNRMLIALSDQPADRLASAAGKRDMAQVLREVLSAPYVEGGQPIAIKSVQFTDFIVQ